MKQSGRASLSIDAAEPIGNWRARLAETWPDAARLLAGAMLAYLIARMLALHEVHWAVLTALITTRGHAGGTARAGMERLLATVAGAGLAIAAAWLRHAGAVDSGVILFLALAPLCLLVAVKPNYRGAPVAALIVLSAGPAAGLGPFDTALLRTAEIAIGALAAMVVSAVVFPSRRRAKPRAHAAAILRLLARWLRIAFAEERGGDARADRLREEIRHELRELTILSLTSGWKKRQDEELERLLKVVSGLNADVGFLVRAVARKPLAPVVAELRMPVREIAGALAEAIETLAAAASAQGPETHGGDDIEGRFKTLAAAARDASERIEPRHVHALTYLLHTVASDLGNVAAVLRAPAAALERKD